MSAKLTTTVLILLLEFVANRISQFRTIEAISFTVYKFSIGSRILAMEWLQVYYEGKFGTKKLSHIIIIDRKSSGFLVVLIL